MRIIGQLPNESSALAFSDFLYVQGISNEVEADAGAWTIWVHAEDELEKARSFLAGFRVNTDNPQYKQNARSAKVIKSQQQEADERASRRFHDRTSLFRGSSAYPVGLVTLLLVAGSVGVTALSGFGQDSEIKRLLFISEHFRGLPEIRHGEVWRLITPIFWHGGVVHLLFNMLWLLDLGSMIEARDSRTRLIQLVLVSAALSNLAEYFWGGHGPNFGGLSGVIYALVAYAWMKGRLNPASGLAVQSVTMSLMMVWFFMCWFNWIPNVANMAHTGGLVVGLIWGFLSGKLGHAK